MAKLTKMAVGALVVAGVTFGAAKGYAYWRVKSQLDELARAVSPYAELRWGGISTELQGAIEVTDLTVAPLQVPDDIAIASLRIDTGDPRLLFTGLPRRPRPLRFRLAPGTSKRKGRGMPGPGNRELLA